MKVINQYIIKDYMQSYEDFELAKVFECENNNWYVEYLNSLGETQIEVLRESKAIKLINDGK